MRLSLQLYTLRDPLQRDLEGTLRQVREMGLEFVELAGLYGRSAHEWKTLLDELGLKVAGSHDGIGRLTEGIDDVIEECRILENRFVVLPWIDESHYSEGWERFAAELEPIGRRLAEEEIVFGYHNHAFELKPIGSSTGLDVLFAAADPSLVKAQLDVGWVAAGGQDPATYVRRHANRLPLVHLKDFSGDVSNHDAEAGQGTLDWDGILRACLDAGVQFGAIEMDKTPDAPLTSVQRCVQFFNSKGLR